MDTLKQYSNAAEVQAEDIPQSVIDEFAKIMFEIKQRKEDERYRVADRCIGCN